MGEKLSIPCKSSMRGGELRTLTPRFLSQNWQSAAPPAIVPSKKGLISMTFFTVCEAACVIPLFARLSTTWAWFAHYLTMHQQSNSKASRASYELLANSSRVHLLSLFAQFQHTKQFHTEMAWDKSEGLSFQVCVRSKRNTRLTNVGALTGSGITSHYDALLEDESKSGSSMIGLDVVHHIPLESFRLQQKKAEGLP